MDGYGVQTAGRRWRTLSVNLFETSIEGSMGPRLKFYSWGNEGEGLDKAQRERLFRFASLMRQAIPASC